MSWQADIVRLGWQLTVTSDRTRLQRVTSISGWFRLTVSADNPVSLHLPGLHCDIALQPDSADRYLLIWYCTGVRDLSIQGADLRQLSLQQLPAWRAYWLLFWRVCQQTGMHRQRLFDLCVARYKRAGMQQVRRKLLEAHQPFLPALLTYEQPYQQWQKKAQPPTASLQIQPVSLIFVMQPDQAGQWRVSLQSLLSQTDPNWQLWHGPATTPASTLSAEPDPRVLQQHQLDPAAYYWPLRAGDLLCPDTVRLLQQALAAKPQLQILYSDHDEPGFDGCERQPQFKPAFCYDSYLSRDYISPAVLYRGSLLQQLPIDFWQQQPSLQLARTLLQLHEPISDQIMHLAWPLLQLASPLTPPAEQGLLAELRQQMVQKQEGLTCSVEPQGSEGFRLRYPDVQKVAAAHVQDAGAANPQVSIIIPTRDQLALTRACVESVLTQTSFRNFEVLLVDNQSSDPDTLRWFSTIAAHPQVRLLHFDAAFNYSAINNFAVAQSQAPFVCLLNNDTAVITPDWLDEMLQHAQRPQIGCVGAKLLFDDNTVQHGGVVLGLWGLAGHSHKHALSDAGGYQQRLALVQNYSAVTAACLLLRRELFWQVGGLNEQALTVAFNDVDLCLKIQAAGYRNLWTPYAALYHFESKSRGREDTPEKKARERAEINYMQQTWPTQIADDPCYSPHLTRQREDYSIAADEPASVVGIVR